MSKKTINKEMKRACKAALIWWYVCIECNYDKIWKLEDSEQLLYYRFAMLHKEWRQQVTYKRGDFEKLCRVYPIECHVIETLFKKRDWETILIEAGRRTKWAKILKPMLEKYGYFSKK